MWRSLNVLWWRGLAQQVPSLVWTIGANQCRDVHMYWLGRMSTKSCQLDTPGYKEMINQGQQIQGHRRFSWSKAWPGMGVKVGTWGDSRLHALPQEYGYCFLGLQMTEFLISDLYLSVFYNFPPDIFKKKEVRHCLNRGKDMVYWDLRRGRDPLLPMSGGINGLRAVCLLQKDWCVVWRWRSTGVTSPVFISRAPELKGELGKRLACARYCSKHLPYTFNPHCNPEDGPK